MTLPEIVVQGAREHNLKGFDLRIPRGSLTTITGVSGSGKSSLAFDTIFQEGQRRFVESLSAYARQFLGNLDKPKVDRVDGLSPTVSIDQKTTNRNPRSTVGTITEIYDHLRLLLARLGEATCPQCGRGLSAFTKDQIADRVLALGKGKPGYVLAPMVRGRKGEYRKELGALRLKGYARARIDGELRRLDEPIELERNKKHTIEVVIDRFTLSAEHAGRLSEAIGIALDLGGGYVAVLIDSAVHEFAAQLACVDCGVGVPELEPRLFSFNSPYGACPECEGLGEKKEFDVTRIVRDENLSIRGGAIGQIGSNGILPYSNLGIESLEQVAAHYGFSLDTPWKKLKQAHRDVMIHGSGKEKLKLAFEYSDKNGDRKVRREDNKPIPGILPTMKKWWAMGQPDFLERYMTTSVCEECRGARLRKEALAVRFRGKNIAELVRLGVDELSAFLEGVRLEGVEEQIGREVLRELRSRLRFLVEVGLGYLPVERGAATLSGGEAQRVRLATQVGSNLQGVLYVLDEPSIGLHQRDNHRLIETLLDLRDRGNTVLVVEHDRDTMLASDFLVDIGPGAGHEGGEIVAAGLPRDVVATKESRTAQYLRGEVDIPRRKSPRTGSGAHLVVRGARQHNLQGVDLTIPLGCLVAVTGVSGSGKSTLVDLVLKRALAKALHGALETPGEHDSIEGLDAIDKVIEIDQTPIGRTPRSNPATYTGAFDHVRDLFALLPESKARGYPKGRFSFNKPGGRCEACEGAGVKVVEMQILADVEVVCEACEGRRYNRETLEVTYLGKSIKDVLDLTVDEACEFFAAHPKLKAVLDTMQRVGLGYVELGQTATTLSGGEAQRLKLATELARPGTGKTLYILDEPTTGLHFADIARLVDALQGLVDKGNTVLVVEHNLDVVKIADWIVDLGPEGGKGGGRIVFEGTPKQAIAKAVQKRSHTGRMLAEYLAPPRAMGRPPRAAVGQGSGAPLRLFGARKNNLKGVDVEIPFGKLTVITGLSGSGKTSLAFDTIFAEAQRRFVESMSTYARRFIARQDRAPVDRIEGLAPAIAIDRKVAARNPRSTVATSTELYDYLRVLYARVGRPHCPTCDVELVRHAPSEAGRAIATRFANRRVRIVAPLFDRESAMSSLLAKPTAFDAAAQQEWVKRGFTRCLVDGEEKRLGDELGITGATRRLDLVIDRVAVKSDSAGRCAEAVEQAYAVANGVAVVVAEDSERVVHHRVATCRAHGVELREEPHPRLFSFNSRVGACPECEGLGERDTLDPARLIVRDRLGIFEGALHGQLGDVLADDFFSVRPVLRALFARYDESIFTPYRDCPAKLRDALLFGDPEPLEVKFTKRRRSGTREYEFTTTWIGLVKFFEQKYRDGSENGMWKSLLAELVEPGTCRTCAGERLNPLARGFRLGGKSLPTVMGLSVAEAVEFFDALQLEGEAAAVARDLLIEIRHRVRVMAEIGLEYLQLGRGAGSLSGGESQRLRLATQLGNRLVGVLYVLDEPTIGLHSRDTERLLKTLRELRDLGNTLVLVEHDTDVIETADHVIEIGPGAGHHGGRIVAAGTPAAITRDPHSLTGAFLRRERRIERASRGTKQQPMLVVTGARRNNLRGVDVEIPTRSLVCVTGVSGSGKSTLVLDVIEPALRDHFDSDGDLTAATREMVESLVVPPTIQSVEQVDQSPLAVTPGANAATYTGVFDVIRHHFAATPEARARGYSAARFSTNVRGGRCEACEGRGEVQIEMHFLSDVFVGCEACGGKRFDKATLEIRWNGLTIAEVLDLEIGAARVHFAGVPGVDSVLAVLEGVGLGYLKLGQPLHTLSGGEAQRVKLAAVLGQRHRAPTLFLLDEPTTGLHLADVAKLLEVFEKLLGLGHSLLVIEHHLELIRAADHVIDLGPGGGPEGGRVVASGAPEVVARVAASATGQRLARAARSESVKARRREESA